MAALACVGFVLAAIAVEVLAGQAANSAEPHDWSRWAPLGWAPPARVLWWLAVGAAAGAHRVLLARARLVRSARLAPLLALPFVVFATGIAAGAPWSTWH